MRYCSIVLLFILNILTPAVAGVNTYLSIKKIENNNSDQYSYIRLAEQCEVYIFKKNGWDMFFTRGKTPPLKYQTLLNGFIEQHERAHCIAHNIFRDKPKRTERVFMKTWLSSGDWTLQDWVDEYYADMYAAVWLAQEVSEEDWRAMVEIIIDRRQTFDSDTDHDTTLGLEGILPYYQHFRTLNLSKKNDLSKIYNLALMWISDALQRKKYLLK